MDKASDWPVGQLGEVVDILTGHPFSSDQYVSDPHATRLLRGDNVAQGVLRWNGAKRWAASSTKGLDQYLLCQGDVILAMDRPWIEAGLKYAVIRKSDLPSLLVQRVARLWGTHALDNQFLEFLTGSRLTCPPKTGPAEGGGSR